MTRWDYMLDEYDFDIEHRAGSKHENADALSRSFRLCPRLDCPECLTRRNTRPCSLQVKRVEAELETVAVVTRARSTHRAHVSPPPGGTLQDRPGVCTRAAARSSVPEPLLGKGGLKRGDVTSTATSDDAKGKRWLRRTQSSEESRGIEAATSSPTTGQSGVLVRPVVGDPTPQTGTTKLLSHAGRDPLDSGQGNAASSKPSIQMKRIPPVVKGQARGIERRYFLRERSPGSGNVDLNDVRKREPVLKAMRNRKASRSTRRRNARCVRKLSSAEGPADRNAAPSRSVRRGHYSSSNRKGTDTGAEEERQGSPIASGASRTSPVSASSKMLSPGCSATSSNDIAVGLGSPSVRRTVGMGANSAPCLPGSDAESDFDEDPLVDSQLSMGAGRWCASHSLHTWRTAQQTDPVLGKVIELITRLGADKFKNHVCADPTLIACMPYAQSCSALLVVDGILLYQDCSDEGDELLLRVVPQTWRVGLITEAHVSPLSGHVGSNRVFHLLRSYFWWKGMRNDVNLVVQSCDSCARQKPGLKANKLRLQQDVACRAFDRIACDVMGPFHESEAGNKYVVVIQDYFSKWLDAFPVPNHTARSVANCLVSWCRIVGCPLSLHTDQGREFESELYRTLCKELGILKTRTSPYAPWSDGMVERANRTLKTAVQHYTTENPKDWDKYIVLLAAAYRAVKHESTGFSPNYLVFGREVNHPALLQYGRIDVASRDAAKFAGKVEYVRELQDKIMTTWHYAWTNLNEAAEKQQEQRTKQGLRERPIALGDVVFVKNPRERSFKHRNLWIGPCSVTGLLSNHLFAIKTPFGPRIVNCNNLKPHILLSTDKMAP